MLERVARQRRETGPNGACNPIGPPLRSAPSLRGVRHDRGDVENEACAPFDGDTAPFAASLLSLHRKDRHIDHRRTSHRRQLPFLRFRVVAEAPVSVVVGVCVGLLGGPFDDGLSGARLAKV